MRPATREEIHSGLRHVLANQRRLADDTQVVEFLHFAVRRNINLTNLWVAEHNNRIIWALLPIVSPGKTMLMLSGTVAREGVQWIAANQIIADTLAYFRRQGVELAQVLVEPLERTSHELYSGCGFEHLAELIYLHAKPRSGISIPKLGSEFQCYTYSPETHGWFAEVIAASYHNSLDCPAMSGLRKIEDVIAGHKSAGEFNAGLWFVACEGKKPLGVLLLSGIREADAMELVYLGLSPEARGRGLGDMLMQLALKTTARESFGRLSLAVDSRNVPALKLYYRYGMQRICSKIAMMQDLRQMPIADASGNL